MILTILIITHAGTYANVKPFYSLSVYLVKLMLIRTESIKGHLTKTSYITLNQVIYLIGTALLTIYLFLDKLSS